MDGRRHLDDIQEEPNGGPANEAVRVPRIVQEVEQCIERMSKKNQ